MHFSSHGHTGAYGSPAGFSCLTAPAQVTALIKALEGGPYAFSLPIHRAALAQELVAVYLVPGGRIPARLLEHTNRATVIVLSGDPADPTKATPSPEQFPQARRLLAWSAGCMLHATGGAASHYAAAVTATKAVRRFLLIETATAQEDAWVDLVKAEGERRRAAGREYPAICISARPRGGVHPADGLAA